MRCVDEAAANNIDKHLQISMDAAPSSANLTLTYIEQSAFVHAFSLFHRQTGYFSLILSN